MLSASSSLRWVVALIVGLTIVVGAELTRAQADAFVGQWRASAPDHDVIITLTIGEDTSKLVFPGFRQNGNSETLNLSVRNLMTKEQVATFSVDLPENEGVVDFEFRTGAEGKGTLRILRIDGETAVGIPPWTLRKTL